MKSEQRVLDARRLRAQIFRVRTPSGHRMIASQPQIPLEGVTYIPAFLDCNEQKLALDIIDCAPWDGFIARRQQYWGEIYYHTTKDVAAIQPVAAENSAAHSLPMQNFDWMLSKLYADRIYREIAPTDPGHYLYRGNELTYAASPAGIFIDEPQYDVNTQLNDKETDAPTQILVNEVSAV